MNDIKRFNEVVRSDDGVMWRHPDELVLFRVWWIGDLKPVRTHSHTFADQLGARLRERVWAKPGISHVGMDKMQSHGAHELINWWQVTMCE